MDKSQKILSDLVIFQKYAKYENELNRRETWDELCLRNMAMHIRKYPDLKEEIRAVYKDFVVPRKVLPSMRSMQFGGRPIEISNSRIFNCAFTAVDHPFVFAETMFNLLSGSGVGYSLMPQHLDKLPVIVGPTEKTRRFLIGDSIEGWSDAIKVLVKAYTAGKADPVFDYRDIRPKGAKLITSGGKAPGPDPLRICVDQVRSVLNGAIGRKLTSIECHDILCHIADAVLSGGIRRAAMIALFDKNDMDMLYAKSGDWWELNPQRGRANNSVLLKRGDVTEEEWDRVWAVVQNSGSGEPGFIWTDDLDSGLNPCVTGDTIVETMVDGKFHKISIEDLAHYCITGNKHIEIKTADDQGNIVWSEVTRVDETRKDAELVRVTDTDSGKTLVCTPNHLVYTKNRGYVEAQLLEENDKLLLD